MLRLLSELEWTRPAGLFALLLPLAVLWLSRRGERPPAVHAGTFRLWDALARGRPRGARRRWRLPLERLLVVLALTCGALALAGPRQSSPAPEAPWRLVVDRSPSMYLAHGEGGRSRLEVALERALALIARSESAQDGGARPLEWWSPLASGELERDRGLEPPREWLVAPRAPRAEPAWERFDAPGVLWITDRAPEPPPVAAGLVAAGGEAVPGIVAAAGGERWIWDGEEGLESARGPAPRVGIDEALPELLRELVRAWAQARGARLAAAGEALELACVAAGEGPELAVRAAGVGWSFAGTARAGGALGPGAPRAWLAARAQDPPIVLVAWGPGELRCALATIEEPEGDPAAFAVAWGELLDRALAPPTGVVPLAERAAAGEPRSLSPRAPPERPRPPRLPLVALLAGAAAALALASLLLALRPRGR